MRYYSRYSINESHYYNHASLEKDYLPTEDIQVCKWNKEAEFSKLCFKFS